MAHPENAKFPFGGVTMVFGGDWSQLLPVISNGTPAEIVNETLKSNPIWKMLKVHILDQNMRLASGENEYAEWLLSVGEGKNFMSDGIHVELPKCICLPTEKDVLEWMYSDKVVADTEQMAKMALLDT
ncbi:hypothetical protein ANCCAN_25298 [Ancylostoma caninum]|uniref:ATP-dependent DNA helicase n=1 Tax=Ancylostoma caninum TaxID=29170 RepID=A0A368FA24_ANCCA|nr:hypothetical protein ANCCAN_25298 [Ancylostoma caninum]